ncbi:DUF3846 domain-containing protein [Microbacterium proteolyticum]|uniref:DUF3846 domain-containing protein n=1 Tax=Microbacterium proteolyticum TaxID=1572644 RepID=UPI001FABFC6D|nr:DUF3846 domain-containing protein [Microbacterium proteolyticum]MCI9857235.1 DUF3846 domain-containing protein [Microbacterium proteolyticum]
MVKSIVIPHDESQRPRLQEMVDIGAFQEAVDGWLELIEAPAIGVTIYVNEAAQRDNAPLNQRAMALWWLYSVNPMRHPLLCGDVVFSGVSDENDGDVPEQLLRDVFDATKFTLDARAHADHFWRETKARFDNVFDAALWCMLLTRSVGRGVQLRVRSHVGTRA